MTSNRARAYRRVISLLEQLGPAKLHAAEQQAVRDAADALIFTPDGASDPEARTAVKRLDTVLDRLVDTDRVMPSTADEIMDAVEACGPPTLVMEVPAAA